MFPTQETLQVLEHSFTSSSEASHAVPTHTGLQPSLEQMQIQGRVGQGAEQVVIALVLQVGHTAVQESLTQLQIQSTIQSVHLEMISSEQPQATGHSAVQGPSSFHLQ
eukprot:GHVT01090444.1.p3 GENE.GHVT01090444.1~~GHVT01090444.1.p3  ORF type:complete len:108 (-),score=11.20 GHVT01090444.1:31-354(-)